MNTHSRGFVLSFATFSLALFLFLFAQAQYTHLLQLQLDAGDVSLQTNPGNLMRDLSMDFNALTGYTISIDENQDTAIFTFKGRSPSVLSLRDNLLRYQSDAAQLGSDLNVHTFLDLNQTFNDGNFWGRTNKGLQWRTDFDFNKFRIEPISSASYPRKIDVNVYSEIAYDSMTVITGSCCITDTVFFDYTLNYTDTNSDHAYSTSGTFPKNSTLSINLVYTSSDIDGNTTTTTPYVQIGKIEGISTALPLGVSILGNGMDGMQYTIQLTLPTDANGVKAGYDINTSLHGNDFNVDTNTIWTTFNA